MKTRQITANDVKPGDTIDGSIVFDFLRPAFGGKWYLPMTDGSRITVNSKMELVTVSA